VPDTLVDELVAIVAQHADLVRLFVEESDPAACRALP